MRPFRRRCGRAQVYRMALREIQPAEAHKGDNKAPDKPVVHPPMAPSGRGVRLSPVSTIPSKCPRSVLLDWSGAFLLGITEQYVCRVQPGQCPGMGEDERRLKNFPSKMELSAMSSPILVNMPCLDLEWESLGLRQGPVLPNPKCFRRNPPT